MTTPDEPLSEELEEAAERIAHQILAENTPKIVERSGRKFEVRYDNDAHALFVKLIGARHPWVYSIKGNPGSQKYETLEVELPVIGRQQPSPWKDKTLEDALDRACRILASNDGFGDDEAVGERLKSFFLNLD